MAIKKMFYLGCAPVLFLLQSCFITNTPGFYSGYKKLNEQEKNQILFPNPKDNYLDKITEKQKIMAITANQLSTSLKTEDSTLVYIWSPFCHSTHCYSIDAIQNYCDQRGIKLFLILDYYDFNAIDQLSSYMGQLYAINQFYYKTDYCLKYTKRFISDLLPDENSKENRAGRYFLFYRGKNIVPNFMPQI